MALTATLLTSASASGAEAQTVTTGAFTPGSNRKLYVLAFGLSASATIDLTIASNTGGLTFGSPIFQDAQNSSDSELGRLALFEATVGTSPGSMTVTLDAGATTKTAWLSYGVFDIVGSVGTPGVKSGQIIGNRGAGAAGNAVTGPSGTLPASGTTGNLAIIFAGRNNDSAALATAPAAGGFSATALLDTGNTIFASVCAFQSSTFTSTTATIADLGQTISCWSTILAEFEESGATGSSSSRSAPLVGPGSVGPFAFMWQQRVGVTAVTAQNFSSSLGGTVTPAGALAKLVTKPLAGTVTPAGNLIKLAAKALAGTVTPAGALVKAVSQSKAGTVTAAGALAKLVSKPLAGSTTPTGALAKLVSKPLGGTVTPTGSIVNVRVVLKSLAGTVTPAGSLVKLVSKSLAGTVTPTGSIVKACSKALAGTVTPAGSLVKVVSKLLAGTVTAVGTIANVRVVLKSLAGTTTPTGTLVKQAQKSVGGTVTPTGSIVKACSKALAGTVTATGALAKAVTKLLAGTVTATGTLVRLFIGQPTATVPATSTGTITSIGSSGTITSLGSTGSITALTNTGSIAAATSTGDITTTEVT